MDIKPNETENLVQCTTSMRLEEVIEYSPENYETLWSKPSTSDYTSMKFLSDILINKHSTEIEVENAILHLQLTMEDYPAEYLLQPPHIFENLLYMYNERRSLNCLRVNSIVAALLQFLFTLENRIKIIMKSVPYTRVNNTSAERKASESPRQLKIEKALKELFRVSVLHLETRASHGSTSPAVWEIIFMVIKLQRNIKIRIDDACLYKLASVAANISLKYAETSHCARFRLYQILLILLLQDVAYANICCRCSKALEVFEPILRDYTMKEFFIQRHQLLEAFVLRNNDSLDEKYKLLKLCEFSFDISIQILKNKQNWSREDLIEKGHSVCSVLDILQSKELVDILFDSIIQSIPLYPTNDELKSQAIQLLLKLINRSVIPLKIYVYEKLIGAFKRHIGCLMTGERYAFEFSNADLLKAHIIGVPINTGIFMQLLNESFGSSCNKIKSNCLEILELFLKSQNLFGTCWYNISPIVAPLLPLFNCCTFSENLMESLLKLYDPDLRLLPYISILQGNLGFLFHSHVGRRSEALYRLVYMLNSLNGAENYVPHLLEIRDTLPNDICFQNIPREYRNIFSDRSAEPCDYKSLNNLLHLLDSRDVEPLIRKTALMQINVLCGNWLITKELCSAGAFFLILQALENALHKSCPSDYIDAAVPAVSILNKVMLLDSSVRCELADTRDIYVLLLRTLMVFHNNIQIRQDITMCLFQLLFSSQLISTENFIEGSLMLRNIQIPVNMNFRLDSSNKTQDNRRNLSWAFATTLEEMQYYRMVIASAYFGGLENVTIKSTSLVSKLDVKDDLKLSNQDVRFIRATKPNVSLHRLITAASNATDHRSLIQAFQLLKQHLIVPTLKYTFSVNDVFCTELNNMLRRYLQLPPGNYADLDLYEHLVDVAIICLKIPLELVALEIFKLLYKDTRHSLIIMLVQGDEIPLRIYYKITTLLRFLIKDSSHVIETNFNASECSSFYSNLFALFIQHCLKLFKMRDLLRVRCLLSLMVEISSRHLNATDQMLLFYCRRFAQFSSALNSFTQTGAQWHKECLITILQLSDQMINFNENFCLNAGFVKYLSGMCGHCDLAVRILAWSVLYTTAKTNGFDSSQAGGKRDISGTEMLINELSYLPGGFMACCIRTLLDGEEAIYVRHLAGQLLSVLIREQGKVDEIENLLALHNFTRLATEALTAPTCVLQVQMTSKLDFSSITNSSYDLISCYSLINIAISQRSPVYLTELCTKSFMVKLYQILKQTPPLSNRIGYLNMVGHICRLYTLCDSDNFTFLQRTIFRDFEWIGYFCQLFGIITPSKHTYITSHMLQLLLILCKDSNALEQLVLKLQVCSTAIVNLFQCVLDVKNLKTHVQYCSLSVLSSLLVKSQKEIYDDLSTHIQNLFDHSKVAITSVSCEEMFGNQKENVSNNKNMKSNDLETKDLVFKIETEKCPISEHLCVSLIQLFVHQYPVKMCNFSTAPNTHQQHITATLALLLKQSKVAQKRADDLKFQEKLIKMFGVFFDEFATTSCTTYLKRNGESKKKAVIKNFQLLLKLLLSWHSSPSMIVNDNLLAIEYSKTVMKIWPWLTHSNDLKLTVLQVCSFLSERSLVICKQFCILNKSSAHSVVELVAKMMIAETLKIKANGTDNSTLISAGLRVMLNCCSCVEGRTLLDKIHVLDVIDWLYPCATKTSQSNLVIGTSWLKFWELFSRYDEGAQLQHLNVLCSVINKSPSGCSKRLISLRILRNISFLTSNRSTLITSTDFKFTINNIIAQPVKNSVEEQFIMCIALWKLITGGIKFISMIRGTKLAKNLRSLQGTLTCLNDKSVKYSNDLSNLLSIFLKIFDD